MHRPDSVTFDEIKVGDCASTTRTVTLDEIEKYASAAQDYNPTHFARNALGERKADDEVLGHGMWIGVLLSHLFGNQLPGPGAVYQSQNLHWHRMVHLGDTVTVTVTVTAKNPENNMVSFDCVAMDQNDKLVASGTAEVFAPSEKLQAISTDLKELLLSDRLDLFDDLVRRAQKLKPVRVAVAYPTDAVSLEGAIEGAKLGFMEPVLYGPKHEIEKVAADNDMDISTFEIVDCTHAISSARKAVLDCREGKADMLMKGSLHTDELMSAVVTRDQGLRTARRISHVFVMDIPSYHKMLLISDAAINILPDLATKADIITNSIMLANALGVDMPKVAILSAVETVYPKIESTIEAAALCKMVDRGQIEGGILDGPLAFDNAISAEAAKIKKIKSDVCGDADILIAPNLEAGNMIAKQLAYLARAEMAGVVLGAKVPVVLTSRADAARARLTSVAIAAILADYMKHSGQ